MPKPLMTRRQFVTLAATGTVLATGQTASAQSRLPALDGALERAGRAPAVSRRSPGS